jgi:hypothetical protein
MNRPRPKSIALNNAAQQRVYRTYEDWQADQKRDTRSPAERGIDVGASVMWRHRVNNIIITDRVMVLAVSGNTITVQVKDVKERTCDVHVDEIVSTDDPSKR